MKHLCIVLILFLSSAASSARSLNYIEAHLLRLSSEQNPTQWLLPFSQLRKPTTFESNVMLSMEKDTYSLYEGIQSKDQGQIQQRLQESFGRPYDVSTKVNFGYRYGNFSQFFSTNAGAVLLATDPVFPELKGFLFHDYTASSSYILRPAAGLMLRPQISYGVRKILDHQYSVANLVDKSFNVKFKKIPYEGFVELNLLSIYSLNEWGQALFQLNSFPVTENDYQYWDTFIGYKTPNFLKDSGSRLTEFSLFGGYSPFYGGEYDVGRTIKVGVRAMVDDFLGLDVFTMDNFYPASILSMKFSYLTVELFTFERAYDDFELQKSREFGANLKATW